MKKANAIIEYSIVIIIVVAAIAGINYLLKRSIQAKIKDEIDTLSPHGRGFGLEWEENTLNWRKAHTEFDRVEDIGANTVTQFKTRESFFTLSLPMPPYVMEHHNASRDVQDVAVTPPQLDNPDHNNDSDDQETEQHD